MTKIYFNKALITSGWVPFLAPILGIDGYDDGLSFSYVDKNQLKEWHDEGKKMIEYTNIKDSDFCVFPIGYKIDFFRQLKHESEKAKKHNKKIIVFYESDNEIPIPNLGNLIVYRTSLRSDSPNFEYALPTFAPSIRDDTKFCNNNNLEEITISYTGYAGKNNFILHSLEYLRSIKIIRNLISFLCYHIKGLDLLDKRCKNPLIKRESLARVLMQSGSGNYYRQKCIDALKLSKYKFIFHERKGVLAPSLKGKFRDEYVDSIYQSTFTMVIRGFGNYAHRFYETMSAGRIPLFINTYSRLPFEDEIKYNQLVLVIPYTDIKNIDKYISSYLKENENKLLEIENNIHNIYEKYFTMKSFFSKIISII